MKPEQSCGTCKWYTVLAGQTGGECRWSEYRDLPWVMEWRVWRVAATWGHECKVWEKRDEKEK